MGYRQIARPRTSAHADQERAQNSSVPNYVLKSNAPAQLWSPRWNGVDNAFRILPELDPENPGAFAPTRLPGLGMHDEPEQGGWIARFHAVKFWGDPGITILLDPDTVDTREMEALNPFCLVRATIQSAINNHSERPGWSSLVGAGGVKAVLGKPTKLWFVQAILFKHNGKPTFERGKKMPLGSGPDDPVVVMQLPDSAGKALLREMRSEVPWKYDPVAIHPGAFVHVFQKGSTPLELVQTPTDPQEDAGDVWAATSGRSGGSGGGGFEGRAYEVMLTETLNGRPGEPRCSLKSQEKMLLSRIQPWDRLLQLSDYDEQRQIMCRSLLACKDEKLRAVFIDVLKHTFRRPELPSEVNDYGRTLAAVSAAVVEERAPSSGHATRRAPPVAPIEDNEEAEDLFSSVPAGTMAHDEPPEPSEVAYTAPPADTDEDDAESMARRKMQAARERAEALARVRKNLPTSVN